MLKGSEQLISFIEVKLNIGVEKKSLLFRSTEKIFKILGKTARFIREKSTDLTQLSNQCFYSLR